MAAAPGRGGIHGPRAFFFDAEEQLVAYARHLFGLAQRQKDGSTIGAHLKVAAARGVQSAIDALKPPEHPRQYTYLLDWFFELHGRRGTGMNGPAPLSWGDFDAWARRTKRDPSPWEFRVLAALDDAFFASAVKD